MIKFKRIKSIGQTIIERWLSYHLAFGNGFCMILPKEVNEVSEKAQNKVDKREAFVPNYLLFTVLFIDGSVLSY